MKKFIFSVVMCFATYVSMSQYIQGTIVASTSSASTFNIFGKSTKVFNYPIMEFDFVVSIPSSASAGVTATASSSTLSSPSGSEWYPTKIVTVGSRTYFGFLYLNRSSSNTTPISFVSNTAVQLATVTFTGLTGKNTVRLTDENSDANNGNYYWYIGVIGTPGQDGSGETSADPTIGQQVYYANAGQSKLGATTGNYQYVETITSTSSSNMLSDPAAITSMSSSDEDKKISVYPSPAFNTINLSLTNRSLKGSVAKVIDVKGSVVKTFVITGVKEQIDLTNLASGMYYIGLANGTTVAFIKN